MALSKKGHMGAGKAVSNRRSTRAGSKSKKQRGIKRSTRF